MSFRMNRFVLLSLLLSFNAWAGGTPQGTAFTYQGVLKQGGAPASGTFHLRFQLFDALTAGAQVGAEVDAPALAIIDGLFNADLDFGPGAFDGSARWLQVQVITNGGATVTTLAPRQAVTVAPYALYALAAEGSNVTNLNASNLVSGTVPGAQLGGAYGNALSFTHASNTFTGAFTGDGAGLTTLNATNIASGTLSAGRLPSGGSWPLSAALNLDSNTLAIDAVNNRLGFGTTTPLTLLHAVGDGAALRLQDDGDPASFTLLEALQPGQMRLNNLASTGTSLIDINPQSLPGTQNAHVRFFRETNTTGAKSVIFHSGNNTSATSAVIGVGGSSSVFQLDGGNVGIGTASPLAPLHLRATGPFLILQDNASAANQAGYIGFWNNLQDETGWVGYGSPGSPHMTIFNERASGDIQLMPASNGSVEIFGDSTIYEGLNVGEFLIVSDDGSLAAFDRLVSDGPMVDFRQNGTIEGTISVTGTTVSYGAFTGCHYGWSDRAIERGTLVVMTGENRRRTDDPGAEPIYGIEPSIMPNDPRCLGAYLGVLEPAQSPSLDNPHQIMAVGNGDMWVVESGRSIQPGDYLISSDVEGHAMLDDSQRFPIGHVIARAAEAVNWEGAAESVTGRRHRRISVFFENFERGSGADAEIAVMRAVQRDLRFENDALRDRLEHLEELVDQMARRNSDAR